MGTEDEKKILWWFIATLLGSVGLNQGINKGFTSVRSDPFSGSQGRILERRIDAVENNCTLIEYRLDQGRSREHDAIQRLESCCRELRNKK